MFPQTNDSTNDPFKRLRDRMSTRLKEQMIEEQILTVVEQAYTEVLRSENVVLSRAERERLLRSVLKDTLDDMLLHISGRE